MTVSPRLTRAALTFLLFGTVTALLPSQDTTALADVVCPTNPQYVLRLVTGYADTKIPDSTGTLSITHASNSPLTLGTVVSHDNGTSFQQATAANFPARTLIYTLNNTGTLGTFSMGSDTSKNTTPPGTSSVYSLEDTIYRTGLYASKTGMSGSISVTFHVDQITLTSSKQLVSN